jgi:hypothetical protein
MRNRISVVRYTASPDDQRWSAMVAAVYAPVADPIEQRFQDIALRAWISESAAWYRHQYIWREAARLIRNLEFDLDIKTQSGLKTLAGRD